MNDIYNTKSYWFDRLNVETGRVTERRLLTHWEASDINHNLSEMPNTNIRYVLSKSQAFTHEYRRAKMLEEVKAAVGMK